ncbi:MAG: PTS sugar transporter subunit IIA [Planctomycetaceae bacterium]|nr:PTS sugar transporter subunit IIA [Planctomycetaceae bacterium]
MELFTISNILAGCDSEAAADAIRRVGGMLAGFGYVRDDYVKGLLERGEAGGQVRNGVAVISAAPEYDRYIAAPGMVAAAYPEGVPWNGADVHAVVGVAATGEILGQMTKCALGAFPDGDAARNAAAAGDAEALFAAFSSGKGAADVSHGSSS